MDRHSITPAGTRVNIIVLAFTLVAGLVVFLRLFTRLVISKGAGLEDACIVFAMVSKSELPSVHRSLTAHRSFLLGLLCLRQSK
jgi:hypothetical protein